VIDRALAQRGLQRCVALTVPHMLVLPAIIASTDLFIDEIEVLSSRSRSIHLVESNLSVSLDYFDVVESIKR
jgi:hypothetical protein